MLLLKRMFETNSANTDIITNPFEQLVFLHREREQEMYGPKKRGPKPKTLLLKVRQQYQLTGNTCMLWCAKSSS